MPVAMVDVWIMGVTMMQRLMGMEMAVRFRIVAMRVVRIMEMTVLMCQWLVPVFMRMPFRKVQPCAKPHQCSSNQQLGRQTIAQHEDGNGRSRERGQ